ncbi:glucokinase [Nitrosospira briensis]|uniref:glucokinase n=1 Tax=Nitrosospira briensis TaxID=35799 RepID=UPI0008EC4D69|nr:glucokinase [Nitrosospira briensis]SFO20838.1 glucokinase [Nitrosospira briensis]
MIEYLIGGDIGGTKTLLQAVQLKEGNARVCCERRYASRAYPSFSDVLREFLNDAASLGIESIPASACLAVAGPIAKQEVALTNLPWVMNAAAIAREFSIPKVKLINDFAAVALSVEILSASDLETLQAGKPYAAGMRVALGAGTGMGGAWLVCQNGRYIALPSEAGHIDFAPADELQARLLQYLRKIFGHVSVERVLSGPGLTNIFNFLQADLSGTADLLTQVHLEADGAAQVADLAFNHKHPIAAKAMDLFAEVYGAYAGNLALAGLCRNGVYVAGGIAPKIIEKLREGGFMKAFRDKGRFSSLMGEIPVHVMMNPKAGLLGAAQEAQRMLVEND